ncbi:MAG TPA: hypothetical protein VLE99_00870 [Candidatus Saccharimonadales bacterium]|nr:hypothetical protein [Candidatus Saccharimonadales bacterium]
MPTDIYAVMALSIIDEQEKLIGPIAYQQAATVPGLSVNKSSHTASISGDAPKVLTELIERYKAFFGNVAVDVCKEAIANLKVSLPPEQLPAVLR